MSGGGVGVGWLVGGTNFQLLILSSNLLKSKIPMSGGGGGGGWGVGWWNQLSTFDAEFKFAKKKKICFCKKFSKFLDKKHNGFVFDFEYQVARPIRSIGEPQKGKSSCVNARGILSAT